MLHERDFRDSVDMQREPMENHTETAGETIDRPGVYTMHDVHQEVHARMACTQPHTRTTVTSTHGPGGAHVREGGDH